MRSNHPRCSTDEPGQGVRRRAIAVAGRVAILEMPDLTAGSGGGDGRVLADGGLNRFDADGSAGVGAARADRAPGRQ
jgi:hypothetical protein